MEEKEINTLPEIDNFDPEKIRENIKNMIISEIKGKIQEVLDLIPNLQELDTDGANKLSKIKTFTSLTKYLSIYYNDCYTPNWEKRDEVEQIKNYENLDLILKELVSNDEFLSLLSLYTKHSRIINILNKICREYCNVLDNDTINKIRDLLKTKFIWTYYNS